MNKFQQVIRNRAIVEFKERNPDTTLYDISNHFSLSFQRIAQVLKDKGNHDQPVALRWEV